ncbi:ABC transporter ATP-binding protein [Nostoc ellipsosporum NOK]|jgi:ABC-2 type transport system ATP-binding protein|nr:ABC transporter ATP-binding protein [Nostoc ellipsosporum NOK]
MDAAIQISGLSFHYSAQEPILDQLDLTIDAGERFGLFGPNGAGKTTLMSLMTGLLPYKTGSVKLLGYELRGRDRKINSLFGLVPQDFSFYPELSTEENLQFFGAWAGLTKKEIEAKSKELLSVLSLEKVSKRAVGKFSGGMKRRVNLAIAVMHNPRVLFLDEPTVGVDVQSRHAIIQYLKQLNQQGTTLIYTSHQLHEAEDLCTRVAMIDEGKIIINDTLTNLLQQHKQDGLEGLFLELTGRAYRY